MRTVRTAPVSTILATSHTTDGTMLEFAFARPARLRPVVRLAIVPCRFTPARSRIFRLAITHILSSTAAASRARRRPVTPSSSVYRELRAAGVTFWPRAGHGPEAPRVPAVAWPGHASPSPRTRPAERAAGPP